METTHVGQLCQQLTNALTCNMATFACGWKKIDICMRAIKQGAHACVGTQRFYRLRRKKNISFMTAFAFDDGTWHVRLGSSEFFQTN